MVGTDERAAISTIGPLRIVTLDTLIPGETHGALSPTQLDWLGRVLSMPAPSGTVIALHHPPMAPPGRDMAGIVLQDPQDLAAVITGTDVRAMLCGHLHLQLSGALAGAAVWATPGTVTRIDLTSPPHLVRGVLGASATLVDLVEAEDPVFSLLQARDPRAGELVYQYDLRSGADVATED